MDFPEDALRRAWARAIRHPEEPIRSHEDPRVVALSDGVIATITVDDHEGERFARVTVSRTAGPPTDVEAWHDRVVPTVARVYLAGRFEPFPVDCVVGADRRTLHYVLDLEAYKDTKAREQVAKASQATGATTDEPRGWPSDAEIAAIQMASPFWALARAWDLEKVRRRDERTITYLSDRFLVPRRWIELQIDLFLADLADGKIDEHGVPRTTDPVS